MNTSEIPKECFQQFYGTYLSCLGEGELNNFLVQGKTEFVEFINRIPRKRFSFTYAEDKWSLSDIILHIIDAERVFQYRALRFLRGDQTSLPGFDQDLYVLEAKANTRSKSSLVDEFIAVRDSTISLFKDLDDAMLTRKGTASNLNWTVGTLGFVISGHQKHHQNIISERYLKPYL